MGVWGGLEGVEYRENRGVERSSGCGEVYRDVVGVEGWKV